MSGRILQINFKYNDVSAAEFEETVNPMAGPISELEGLLWKIMMLNEETSEAGGIYLFENAASVNNYLSGPIVAQVTSHPALSDFSVKQFGIMEGFTKITRGPVGDLAVT
jgi:hypothetical protein